MQVLQGLKVHAHLVKHVSLCGHLVENMNVFIIAFTSVIASLFITFMRPNTIEYPNGKVKL